MAASSRSSQYLHDHFNERAERVNNLQAEVNRLQDENKILHIKLAEEKIKTQGLIAVCKNDGTPRKRKSWRDRRG